ncbi:MAG: alpha/beta fold hydrolase [Gallionellaceae bacterium]|nr:alpha/beta fold hydrolase [Gallionellaceae bacterium]
MKGSARRVQSQFATSGRLQNEPPTAYRKPAATRRPREAGLPRPENHSEMEMFKSISYPGGNTAILLFHGLSSSPLELLMLGRGLQRAGYSVYLPYLPGYGDDGQGRHRHITDSQDWVRQAVDEFDRVRERHEHVIVGGLCIGATLALQLAALRDDKIAGIIAMSVTLMYDGWSLPWYRILLPLAAHVPFGERYSFREGAPYGVKDERMRSWIAREMNHAESSMAGSSTLSARSLIEARRLYLSVRNALPSIEAPALILHAIEDEMSSPRNAEYVLRHLGSRDSRLVMLRDSYHMITLDREKDRVLDEIRHFLADIAIKKREKPAATGLVVSIANAR